MNKKFKPLLLLVPVIALSGVVAAYQAAPESVKSALEHAAPTIVSPDGKTTITPSDPQEDPSIFPHQAPTTAPEPTPAPTNNPAPPAPSDPPATDPAPQPVEQPTPAPEPTPCAVCVPNPNDPRNQ